MIISKKTCSVEGCDVRRRALGYCGRHYQQVKKGNTPTLAFPQEYHGLSHTLEYDIWTRMKARCTNKNDKDYSEWGGRGITVCPEWANSFATFNRDMGQRPSLKHSLDRIDNDGNYEPSNCRWATTTQQALNKRLYKKNKTGYSGIYIVRNKYRVQIRRNNAFVHIGYYKDLGEAVKALNSAKSVVL